MYENDLDDLESQLYSQVFHSTEDVDVHKSNLSVIPTPTDQGMTKRNRYFQQNTKVSSPKFQNISVDKCLPSSPNNQNNGGYYSKTIGKAARYDPVYQNKPQRKFDRPPVGKRKQKKKRTLAAMAKKQRQPQIVRPVLAPGLTPPAVTVPSVQITLTDSEDDDSCIVVENKWPVVSVAESDDETKVPTEDPADSFVSNSDDVIFVEPVEVPCVVINLDEEFEVNANSEKEHVFNSPRTVKQIHQERSELLHTPDSTSNDFINTCGVDLDKTNFNFELHGTDFKSNDLSKNKVNESCETESGSSTTTDFNIPIIIKTAVFSEVDFPRNDLFDENNLENFGKFITPLRKSIAKNPEAIQSSPICKALPVPNTYSSDSSSSESDFDEQDNLKQSTKLKKLPDLSPMQPPSQETDALKEIAENNKLSKRNRRKRPREEGAIDEEISIYNILPHRLRPLIKDNEEKKINIHNMLPHDRRSLIDQNENKKFSNELSENTKRKQKRKSAINQESENKIGEEPTITVKTCASEVDINLAQSSNETQENFKRKGKKKSVNNQETEDTKDFLSIIEYNEEEIDKGSSKRKAKKRSLISLESENKYNEESFSTADGLENCDKNPSQNSCIEPQEGSKRKARKKSINNQETDDKVTSETSSKGDRLDNGGEKNISKKSFSESNDTFKRKGRKKSFNSQGTDDTVIEEPCSSIKHSEDGSGKNPCKKLCDETQESPKGKAKKKSIINQETENVGCEATNMEHSETKEEIEDLNAKTVEVKDVNEPSKTVQNKEDISDGTKETDNSQLKDFVIIDETFADDSKATIESDPESVLSALHVDVDVDLSNCQIQSEHMENDSTVNSSNRPTLSLAMASVGEIQRSMSNNQSMWKILDSDKYPGRRPSGRRCNRCRDKGHIGIRCPKNMTPVCFICGAKDHYEPRCPKKICTQCGQRRNYFTTYCSACFNLRFYQCTICSMMGHSEDKCPDLWRRYHLTTEEGPLNISEAPSLKPIEEQWCSACAQPGHLEFTCNYVRLYPPHDPRIQCYEDVLSSDAENTSCILPPQQNYNNFNRGNQFSQLPVFDLGGYTDFSLPYNNMLNNVPNIGAIADLSRLLLPYATNFAQNSYSHENQDIHHQQNRNLSPRKSSEYYTVRPQHSKDIRVMNQPSNYERPQHSKASPKNVIDHDSRHDLSNHIIKATQLWNKKSNSIFFNGSTERIVGVINDSLAELSKLSLKSRQDPVQFKKSLNFNKHNLNEKLGYYKTLNMVLFGIYNLVDGKMHLSRLKAMKFNKGKTRLNNIRRQELMTSYAYIFGNKKNDGIDYNELLRRI